MRCSVTFPPAGCSRLRSDADFTRVAVERGLQPVRKATLTSLPQVNAEADAAVPRDRAHPLWTAVFASCRIEGEAAPIRTRLARSHDGETRKGLVEIEADRAVTRTMVGMRGHQNTFLNYVFEEYMRQTKESMTNVESLRRRHLNKGAPSARA